MRPTRMGAGGMGRRLASMIAAGALGVAGFGAAGVGAAVAAPAAGQAAGQTVQVIVGHDGSGAAEDAVRRAGGSIGQRLDLVGSFTARVPHTALAALGTAQGVRTVTPDGSVQMAAARWMPDSTVTTMATVTQQIGAQSVWARTDPQGRRVTGTGIGVALIDSGIAPVKGLNTPARVINGPDLSLESPSANLRHLDTFGHGTHMAGIILGRDPDVTTTAQLVDANKFVGVAPDANLINIKVAAADGAVDVSQVIAGIEWVVAHRNDPGVNIRVLNLSFGTDSLQATQLDPLSHAVEAAWRKGIVVVVAAGNNGSAATRLSMPAMNPYVIAVGGSDTLGTVSRTDDIVGSFSSRGSTTRKPDLVAPGKSIMSLRDPNSYIDINYPGGLVPGDTALRYFRGSGTSQAAAVTSGAAALLLQHRPNLTPDQVKKLLTSTASPMPNADSIGRGAGQLDVNAALNAATPVTSQTFAASTGTGTLDGSRGTARIADPVTGVELTGERDIMNKAWTATTWASKCTTATTWTGGTYNGATWTGGGWTGTTAWAAKTWATAAWSSNWANQTWSASAATASSTATWDGRTWSGRTWSGRTWSGRTWSGNQWSSRIWD